MGAQTVLRGKIKKKNNKNIECWRIFDFSCKHKQKRATFSCLDNKRMRTEEIHKL